MVMDGRTVPQIKISTDFGMRSGFLDPTLVCPVRCTEFGPDSILGRYVVLNNFSKIEFFFFDFGSVQYVWVPDETLDRIKLRRFGTVRSGISSGFLKYYKNPNRS